MEMTLEEAAARLGLSAEAVRKRVARGTLAGRRVGRRLLVMLPDDAGEPPDAPADADRPPTGRDRPRPDGDRTALERHLEAEVAYLRGELSRAQDQVSRALDQLAEERRRSDTLMGMLASRPAELAPPAAAPAVPRETMPPTPPEPESPSPGASSPLQGPPGGAGEGPSYSAPNSPTTAPRRPWWRLFG